MKKAVVLLLVSSLLLFMFSCSKGNSEKSQPSEEISKTQEEVEFDLTPESKLIKVWLFSNDPEMPLVDDFCRMYPEYKVDNSEASTSPFGNPYNRSIDLTRIAGLVASNEQPDMIIGYMSATEAYYSDLFMSINDYLTHDPEFNFDTLDPNSLKEATFDGEVYFLPLSYTAPVFVWNKKLFENAGLDPEKPPKTWSEVIEYSEKLVSYEPTGELKTIGFPPLTNHQSLYFWYINSFGKHITDETGLTLDVDNDSFNKYLEFLRSLTDVYGGSKMLPSGFSFTNGNVAMDIANAAGLGLTTIWCDFDFGFSHLPVEDGTEGNFVASNMNNILCFPKGSKNPKGGWMFAKFQMTEGKYTDAMTFYENNPNKCMLNYIGHIPTRERLYNELKDVLKEESWERIYKRDEIIASANSPQYGLAVQSEFDSYFIPEYKKMLDNEISPKELITNAQSYGEALIKDFKKLKEEGGWVFDE